MTRGIRIVRILLGLLVVAAALRVFVVVRQYQSSAAAPLTSEADLTTPEQMQRLLALPLSYEERAGSSNGPFLAKGEGEHQGGRTPVTAHPSGPAFGPGVKVAMTDAEFYQFYQAYQSPEHPVFVTADSLLQAYLAVLGEALTTIEAMETWELRDAVRAALEKVDSVAMKVPDELAVSARRLARINIAIVLRLLDEHAKPALDEAIERIVDAEVAKVEAGDSRRLPDWLHDPKDDLLAIDYRVFRPSALRSRPATRRFRAVRWLQVVPWRLDRDDHLLATLLAARVAVGTKGCALRDRIGSMLYPPDDVDAAKLLEILGEAPLDVASLKTVREKSRAILRAAPPQLTDVIRLPPKGGEQPTVRWRSAGRPPDLVALRLAFGDRLPSGLALCASLGSKFAQSRPEAGDWSKAKLALDESRLSGAYWKAIAALFESPPPNAPAFMNHLEWQIKSCQTALSGWVQWRRETELFGKQSYIYLNGGPPKLRGAVEPNIEFFRRLSKLARRTRDDLAKGGWLERTPRRCAATIPDRIDALNSVPASKMNKRRDMIDGSGRLTRVPEAFRFAVTSPQFRDEKVVVAAALAQMWTAAEANRWPEPLAARKLLELLDEPVELQLKQVAELSDQCAAIAEKLIRGEALSESDNDWFLDYGRRLAGIAGYEGHADDRPADDAAKAVEVGFDPGAAVFRTAAVGRPRALWVLYPYQGQEVLCRGAVYPYFEFDSPEKPSDEEWRKTVINGATPPQPEWIKPLLRTGGEPSKPE